MMVAATLKRRAFSASMSGFAIEIDVVAVVLGLEGRPLARSLGWVTCLRERVAKAGLEVEVLGLVPGSIGVRDIGGRPASAGS